MHISGQKMFLDESMECTMSARGAEDCSPYSSSVHSLRQSGLLR